MRADRLLSMLMILQSKGMVTAAELAQQLEVTERTVYRDVDALSAAGIPVYTSKGPGGGIGLVEEYRNSLTALKQDEVRALFLLEIPPVLEQLGVGETVRKAMMKLSSTMSRFQKEEQVNILLDPLDWNQQEEPVPWLKICQEALQEKRMLELTYRSEFNTDLIMQVMPLGLVAKMQRWYLVVERGDHYRTLQVTRIRFARKLLQTLRQPSDFDLGAYWKKWCQEQVHADQRYLIRVRVTPTLAQIIEQHRPANLMSPPMVDDSPWVERTLEYESFEEARRTVLGYGGAIEVLEPLALRRSVQDYARQIITIYDP
jgi:predicted DNA-binding transcriptional regulator YafY